MLIPGAGTDPRVYGATIEALGELGHEGIAPELPLDDPGAPPSAHADAVLAAIVDPAGTVITGQSLGAYAATIAAARAPVARLILLAPMIPAPGESAGEWWANTRHEDAITGLVERFGPMREWGDEAMDEVFLHDVAPEVARESVGDSSAPGHGMFGEALPLDAWPDVPTTVLVPREDRLFPIDFQRRVARERLGLQVEEMDGGHLPMLSRPGELARRLVEISA